MDFIGPFLVDHLDVVLIAIAGAIAGPLVFALGSLAVSAASAVLALGPFIIAGAAIGALAYLIVKNWGTVYPAIKPILDGLAETLGSRSASRRFA